MEDQKNELLQPDNAVPEWQIELVKQELQNIANGQTELIEWGGANRLFNNNNQVD
ncbi:MAG: hypothetical protein M3O71_14590 [Bacteroidota bacterium]|nr:hypothetical protein [Bacteroidota bacterium]